MIDNAVYIFIPREGGYSFEVGVSVCLCVRGCVSRLNVDLTYLTYWRRQLLSLAPTKWRIFRQTIRSRAFLSAVSSGSPVSSLI